MSKQVHGRGFVQVISYVKSATHFMVHKMPMFDRKCESSVIRDILLQFCITLCHYIGPFWLSYCRIQALIHGSVWERLTIKPINPNNDWLHVDQLAISTNYDVWNLDLRVC